MTSQGQLGNSAPRLSFSSITAQGRSRLPCLSANTSPEAPDLPRHQPGIGDPQELPNGWKHLCPSGTAGISPTPGSPRKQEWETHSTGKEHNFYFIKKTKPEYLRPTSAKESHKTPQLNQLQGPSSGQSSSVSFWEAWGFFASLIHTHSLFTPRLDTKNVHLLVASPAHPSSPKQSPQSCVRVTHETLSLQETCPNNNVQTPEKQKPSRSLRMGSTGEEVTSPSSPGSPSLALLQVFPLYKLHFS